MSAGFVINANYTWAHALDEISNGGLLGVGVHNILGQINPLNFRANNYGNADYDIRSQFNANWVWTEPYHFNNRAANGILGGWIFSENFITRSGLPYSYRRWNDRDFERRHRDAGTAGFPAGAAKLRERRQPVFQFQRTLRAPIIWGSSRRNGATSSAGLGSSTRTSRSGRISTSRSGSG